MRGRTVLSHVAAGPLGSSAARTAAGDLRRGNGLSAGAARGSLLLDAGAVDTQQRALLLDVHAGGLVAGRVGTSFVDAKAR